MSEDRTKEIKDARTLEERVFARFESVEGRLMAVETHVEARQYDTKPIWERALAEIGDLRTKLKASIEDLRTDLRSQFQTGIEGLRIEMKAEFVSVRHTMEHELRKVGRQVDALNQNLFQMRVDQRYVDRRLAELEKQSEPGESAKEETHLEG